MEDVDQSLVFKDTENKELDEVSVVEGGTGSVFRKKDFNMRRGY